MRPFGFKDKLGYYFGDVAGSFVNLYVDAYFLLFATTVLGINPAHMGTLFLVARLWDAINDPIMGSIPDRFMLGKSGDKFKPYIKLAMIPLAISGILCFTDVSSLAYTSKLTFASIAYILFGMSYTATSMPFGSMASVLTDKPVERAELSKMRAIGGITVAYVALSFVPMFAFDKAGQAVPSVFRNFAIVFGICSVILYTLCTKLTTERIKANPEKPEEETFKYSEVIKGVLKNRPLLGVMFATIGSLIFITGNGQLGAYMYKDFYQNPKILSIVGFANLPLVALAFVIISPLVKRFGKKAVIVGATIYNLIGALILFLVPIASPMVFLVLNVTTNFGQTFFTMLIWAFVTDCIDYQEYITGIRADGSLYSIYTFSRKMGSTIASGMAGYLLGWIGYASGVATQSPEVMSNIRTMYTALPLVVCVIELIGMGLIFNLSQTKVEEVTAALKAKKQAAKA